MMASKLVVRRGFAQAAHAAGTPLTSAVETKVSRLPNGLTVASVELGGATSSLALVYKAGSRYQQPDEGGLVHHLRNNVGKDSANYLGVKLLWQLGFIGGNLSATHGKDFLAIQTNVIRDQSKVAASLLGEFAKPALKHWDVDESAHTLAVDVNSQTPFNVALELAHQAAFRNGSLANSVLAQPFEIGKRSVKQLEAYSKSRLVTSEAIIIGVNVEHSDLLGYAQDQTAVPEGRATAAQASPYVGGDSRQNGPSSIAHVVIVGQGAPLNNVKEYAAQQVLASLIGSVKFSGTAGYGVVGSAVQQAANQRPVGVSAVNVSHTDVGLAGVYIAVEGQYAEPIVKAAFSGLKQIAQNVDAAAFEEARNNAKLQALLKIENPRFLVLDQAADILANASATTPLDLAKEIAQVSVEDVKKAAQKIVQKPSVGAYGRINQVPYVDQL